MAETFNNSTTLTVGVRFPVDNFQRRQLKWPRVQHVKVVLPVCLLRTSGVGGSSTHVTHPHSQCGTVCQTAVLCQIHGARLQC